MPVCGCDGRMEAQVVVTLVECECSVVDDDDEDHFLVSGITNLKKPSPAPFAPIVICSPSWQLLSWMLAGGKGQFPETTIISLQQRFSLTLCMYRAVPHTQGR